MKTQHLMTYILATLTAATLLAGCMPYSTGPTEVGVRTVKWSMFGAKGVQPEIYQPGSTHFFVPFVTDWHTFDTRLQKIEMTAELNRGDRPGRDELVFKTIDGNDIGLDMTIQYKIIREKAPEVLQNVAMDDNELKENIVRTITRSKPRDIFAELKTEDFYISDKRIEKAERTKVVLNEILAPYGVIVERLNLGTHQFNADYQQAIEEKKVADQEVEKLKAETRAKEAEFLMKVESAKAEVETVRAEANGEFERAGIEADAYYEQQKSLAQAIMAEGLAEAEGILKMNEALSGAGGEAMVKLEIAESLMNKRIIMLPMGGGGLDVRSTDVNALLDLYGIQQLIEKSKAKPVAARKTSATTQKRGGKPTQKR